MTGQSRITISRRPAPVRQELSNQELIAGWTRHLAGSALNTRLNLVGDVQSFALALNNSGLRFSEANGTHLRDYMAGYMGLCSSLQWGPNQPDRCLKRLDLTKCGSGCAGFKLKARPTFSQHMGAVVKFYGWLSYEGHITANWTRDVVKQYADTLQWPRPRQEDGYRPKLVEVRRFIGGSEHEHRRAIYATMAKLGLRIHEPLAVRRADVDLDNRWLSVPPTGKRRGNARLPIDGELRRELEVFIEWRDRRPLAHDFFFTNHRREPLGRSLAARGSLNRKWWQPDAVRLGLQPEGFVEPHLRWHTHSMRHFFSDFISEAGCPDPWYSVLRGDDESKTMRGTYTHTRDLDRIRDYYTRYAPIIGWR